MSAGTGKLPVVEYVSVSQFAMGAPGTPGPLWSALAVSPMLAGRWWHINPFTPSFNTVVTLDQVAWQPVWTGDNTKLLGVHFGASSIIAETGNLLYFAAYRDSGELWPKEKMAELGSATTAFPGTNQGRVVNFDLTVVPNTLIWFAYLCQGGTAPSLRGHNTGHPLIQREDNATTRTTSATSVANALVRSLTAFPDPAGASISDFGYINGSVRLMLLPGA